MKTITIKKPVAKIGQKVWVHNYRSKRKDNKQLWERGTLLRADYSLQYKSWGYAVMLDRMKENNRGSGIWIYSADGSISIKNPTI